jgi:hypothetical protein
MAFDVINNPVLIKCSWERCVVGKWNLSWESITSVDARKAMLALRKTDPQFWAEIEQPRSFEREGTPQLETPAQDGKPEHEMELDSDKCPFGDDEDYDELDSAVDVDVLIQQVISPDAAVESPSDAVSNALAENLDPGQVTVPKLRRGKRRKTSNRLYQDFIVMSDEDADVENEL